jgi:hypothetical protein
LIGYHLQKLLSIAGSPICGPVANLPASLKEMAGRSADSLIDLLKEHNGFYAFESALHVLPSNCLNSGITIGDDQPLPSNGTLLLSHDEQGRAIGCPMDLERWNMRQLWRKEFGIAAEGLLFFAEDTFGEQFALLDGRVLRFNPESAAKEEFALNLNEWAERILADYSYETGYQQVHDWQLQNGPLQTGNRLIPKIPFIMGGAFEVENLFALDAVKAMRYRADIWKQIRNLPDGTPVQLKPIW